MIVSFVLETILKHIDMIVNLVNIKTKKSGVKRIRRKREKKEGDIVKVKLIGIDHKTGKFKMSRKALMPKPEGRPNTSPRE